MFPLSPVGNYRQSNHLLFGISLAMAEMSLALAVLYRPNGPKFELFETDESDVKPVHDFMIPVAKLSSKGVRVLIS